MDLSSSTDATGKGNSDATKRIGRLGPYMILKKIGQGGMGKVYLGLHSYLNVHHAIKVLPSTLANNQMFVKRFLREAAHAAKLNHPYIVRVVGADEHNGVYYMAMEYVPGQNLQEFIDLGGIEIAEAVRFGHQVALALDHAHKAGVIHRDVKPENVLVSLEGNAKLMDFGLGRDMVVATQAEQLTAPGVAVGTPHFMSPEQWRNENVDHRSDIYALGVTLFHLLTNRFPYEGNSVREITELQAAGKLTRLDSVLPDCDPILTDVVHRMLHSGVSLRPQSAIEVVRELERWWSKHGPRGERLQAITDALASEVSIKAVRDADIHPQSGAISPHVETADLSDLISPRADAPVTPAPTTTLGDRIVAAHGSGAGFEVNNAYGLIYHSADHAKQTSCIAGSQFLAMPGVRLALQQFFGEFANVAAVLVHEFEYATGTQARLAPFFKLDAPQAVMVASRETRYRIGRDSLDGRRYLSTNQLRNGLRLPTGQRILPLHAHHCMQPGSVMYYDLDSQILFTGSFMGAFVAPDHRSPYATADQWYGMKAFHQLFMPSHNALLRTIALVRELRPAVRVIAPSRGLLIEGELIDMFLTWLGELRVGPSEIDRQLARGARIEEFNQLLHVVLDLAKAHNPVALMRDLEANAELRKNLDFGRAVPEIVGLGPESVEQVIAICDGKLTPQQANALRFEAFLESERLGISFPRLLL